MNPVMRSYTKIVVQGAAYFPLKATKFTLNSINFLCA